MMVPLCRAAPLMLPPPIAAAVTISAAIATVFAVIAVVAAVPIISVVTVIAPGVPLISARLVTLIRCPLVLRTAALILLAIAVATIVLRAGSARNTKGSSNEGRCG